MKKNNNNEKNIDHMSQKNMKTKVNRCVQDITKYLENILGPVLSEEDIKNVIGAIQESKKSINSVIASHFSLFEDDTPKDRKVKKDPNAPKRGKTSYIFFCIEQRPEIKKANPELDAKSITKELGRMWREELDEKSKAKYIQLAKDDNIRYKEEMKTYTPPPVEYMPEKKKKKTPTGPKRPMSSYLAFCKSKRSELKESGEKITTKELTEIWNNMEEVDKKGYQNIAAKDKKRYVKEKEEWKKNESDEDVEDVPETKARKKKDVSKRKSGYILFCQENRDDVKNDNPTLSATEVTKILNQTWKSMEKEEKTEYNDRARSVAK